MKRKLYYVITPQLDDVDGFKESNGWKTISVYDVVDNTPTEICDLDVPESDNSIVSIKDRLAELLVDVDNIELIQL